MNAELIVLRLIHVLGGILWVGIALYNTFVIIPAMVEAGPAAANALMTALTRRKIFAIIPAIAGVTILAGLRLMQISSDGFSAAYFASRTGRAFAGGATMGVLGLVFGIALVRPMMMKAGALAAARGSAPENARAAIDAQIATARSRGAFWSVVSSLLLLVAAMAMAVARYL